MTRGELVAGFISSLVIGTLNDDTAAFHGAVSKSMTTLSQNAQAAKSSPDTAAFVNALALALSDVRARKDAAAQAALTPQARYAIEITQLYVTLLERVLEPSALLSAIESRRQGRSFEAIAGDILASYEIQGKLARTLDDPAFVDALFAQALGRAPGTDERAALLGKLARAELTRAQLVIGLIADTDAYRGGEPQILAGGELLGPSIDTAPSS